VAPREPFFLPPENGGEADAGGGQGKSGEAVPVTWGEQSDPAGKG